MLQVFLDLAFSPHYSKTFYSGLLYQTSSPELTSSKLSNSEPKRTGLASWPSLTNPEQGWASLGWAGQLCYSLTVLVCPHVLGWHSLPGAF